MFVEIEPYNFSLWWINFCENIIFRTIKHLVVVVKTRDLSIRESIF